MHSRILAYCIPPFVLHEKRTFSLSIFVSDLVYQFCLQIAIYVDNLAESSLLKFTLCPHAVLYADNILLLVPLVCHFKVINFT